MIFCWASVFGLAGEHFASLDVLLVEVPDDALPATIGAAEYIAVGGESFLWHGAAPFLNHQHYRIAFAYVQTNVVNGAEKNRLAFWWIYTCRWAGNFSCVYSLFSGADFEVALAG